MAAEIAKPVCIPYELLISDADLSQQIEEAFGFAGLGLLVVSGIPNFKELRDRCLPLGRRLANLPPEALKKIEHKESNFSVGWSHGKERLKKGSLDTYKGSFYANPQYDNPTADPKLMELYPQDYHPNLWPEELPELQTAFKALGSLMVEVGCHIARHCDKYVRSKLGDAYKPANLLESIISNSRVAKGRLLHYFPIEEDGERQRDSWCGWHNDHSCLTALCSSYYMDVRDESYVEIACPDPDAGLYARTRTGKEMKIPIPRDCLAFQIGESSQILTGGILRATPHAVQAVKYPESKYVCRDTLAVFMQPNHDLPMTPPEGVDEAKVAVGQWKPGQTYGEFSKVTIQYYYTDG